MRILCKGCTESRLCKFLGVSTYFTTVYGCSKIKNKKGMEEKMDIYSKTDFLIVVFVLMDKDTFIVT